MLFTPDTQSQVDACLRKVTVADPNASTIVEATCALGGSEERTIEMAGVNLLHSPDVEGIALNFVDRTALRRALDLAEWQARFDSLTGLPNRRTLESAVGNSSAAAKGSRRSSRCWTSTT